MQDRIVNDNLLWRYPITVHGVSGLRAYHLGQQEVEMAKLHSHVIIIVGNNDLSQWKNLPVYTPLQTATNLFNFVNLLRNNGLVVALVGVFKRLDIPVAVATETNGYLVSWLPQGVYVKPRIARKHFLPNDRSHLNAMGQLNVLELLNRVIVQNFGF